MDYMEFKNQMLAEIEERLTEKEYACYEPADGNMLEESLVIQEGNELIRFGATTTSMYRVINRLQYKADRRRNHKGKRGT